MSASVTYQPPSVAADIDLDLSRNEGLPGAIDYSSVLADLDRMVSRYPNASRVRDGIARTLAVAPEQVLVTAGGDEGLSRCFRSFAGATVVTTTPTFEMVGVCAAQTGSKLVEIPWSGEPFPLTTFTAVEADVAVIVSPNNPTGSVIDAETLRAVASAFDLVLLDSAYTEFADADLTTTALSLGNVLVIRTLSKAYGLAGLRVGYVLGPMSLVDRIAGFGNPYAVSTVSLRLAEAALAGPRPDLSDTVRRRQLLTELLDDLDLDPLPSQGNFVLATNTDPEWLVGACSSLGIGLRGFPGRQGLERSVRVTVPRTDNEFHRLEAAIRSALHPEAILFDLDGVIADVSASYREAIVATAASFGVSVGQRDVQRLKAAGDANDDWELTRRLCEANGVDLTYDLVVERFEEIYHGTAAATGLKMKERLLVDRAGLAAFAERLPLAVVTGRPRKDAIEFLQAFDLVPLFETIVAREDAPMKPDPAPVRLALEHLGVSRAWMLGDTRDDLEAARAAGVIPICVGPQPIKPAAAVIETVASIKELLDETLS